MNDGATAHTRSRLAQRLGARVDLLAVAVLAVLCGALAGLVGTPALRVPAALALVLVLPGYALGALVFAGHTRDAAQAALGALGGSLVVSALGGLLLDGLPGHMGRAEWATLLMALTVAAAAAAHLREGRAAVPARDEDSAATPREGSDDARREGNAPERGEDSAPPPPRAGGGTRRWAARARLYVNLAACVLSLCVATAAVLIARHSANRYAGFTALSARPQQTPAGTALLIQISSHEHRAASFSLVLERENRRLRTLSVRLRAGGERRLSFGPIAAGSGSVTAKLFRAGARTPYLHTVYYPPGGVRR